MARYIARWVKGPDDTDRYIALWDARLASQGRGGDAITGFAVDVPAGLTLEYALLTGTATEAWISGGTVGQSYDVVFRLTLTHPDGASPDVEWARTVKITVAER